jgi:hypothetical protein
MLPSMTVVIRKLIDLWAVVGFSWPDAATGAAWVQAAAAAVICGYTIKLAELTERYAKAADKAAKSADDSANAANASVELTRVAMTRDDQEAERVKKYFLIAIGMELEALHGQLDASLEQVTKSIELITKGEGIGPSYSIAWRTTVFSTQVGKLRDVADPLLIEVIHFYTGFQVLEQIRELVNDLSADYVTSGSKEEVRGRLLRRLKTLHGAIQKVTAELLQLKARLS